MRVLAHFYKLEVTSTKIKKMVSQISQSKNGFPNFSIKKWFPKFLNQKMVSQISQSKNRFPKFLNQKMVYQKGKLFKEIWKAKLGKQEPDSTLWFPPERR